MKIACISLIISCLVVYIGGDLAGPWRDRCCDITRIQRGSALNAQKYPEYVGVYEAAQGRR